jgi:hypothetical protein
LKDVFCYNVTISCAKSAPNKIFGYIEHCFSIGVSGESFLNEGGKFFINFKSLLFGEFIAKSDSTAIDFSLELITLLVGADVAENIAKAVQYR